MTYVVFRISQSARTKYIFSQAQNLLTVTVLQGAIGYTQYFTDVPALLVGFHIAGAVAVWIMTLRAIPSLSTSHRTKYKAINDLNSVKVR